MPICSRRCSRSRGGRPASIWRRVGGPISSTASTRAAGTSRRCGVTPLLGRTFTTEDDRRGGGPDGPVAVISHAFWQRRFGGSADVIGKTQTIDRVPFTIVGVMRPDFFGTNVGSRSDVILPIGTESLDSRPRQHARSRHHVVAAGDGAAEKRSVGRLGRAGAAGRPAANPGGDDAHRRACRAAGALPEDAVRRAAGGRRHLVHAGASTASRFWPSWRSSRSCC